MHWPWVLSHSRAALEGLFVAYTSFLASVALGRSGLLDHISPCPSPGHITWPELAQLPLEAQSCTCLIDTLLGGVVVHTPEFTELIHAKLDGASLGSIGCMCVCVI